MLDLSFRGLTGTISPYVGNLSFMMSINLENNFLHGQIPQEVGILPNQVFGGSLQFTVICLSHNYLTGTIPFEVGTLENLITFDISENRISGEIPSAIGSCMVLVNLYLQGNFFQGVIPSSFGYLKGIEDMDLSRNNLFGKIPRELQNLPFLKSLNLSFNNLMGEVPSGGIFQNVTAFSIVVNENLCGGVFELNLQTCHIQSSKKKGMPLALTVALGTLLLSLIITSLFLLYSRRRRITQPISNKSGVGDSLQRISYNVLRDATNGFSSESLIGIGSYGSVYRGVLHKDESIIAVKVLNLMERGASKSFIAECDVLREVQHRNLLILTICSSADFQGNNFKALIFEYMHNGSVENWLHPVSNRQHQSVNFDFSHRLDILIDIASTLNYLHNQCKTPIVHCDLKPSNVLLDEDMVAYVGDFGLAKFLCKNTSNFANSETSSIAIRGTIGYIPPEYGTGAEVSTQGDVYSYGILMLEMLAGKTPTDAIFNNGLSLHSLCKANLSAQKLLLILAIIDIEEQRCVATQMQECFISVMKIGVACSSGSIGERMEIKAVLIKLHTIKEALIGIGNDHQINVESA
ncbi:hypothetical protein AQUCO_01700685v1 [Aquilegia coerulea]|uniref:non-specific serine/threonine protein kinase n=1 Tax=Aquilegia coerulea TaxID=218851 RepID=A0A2G5DP60_AQUCA|nr:hypothetical protein AQUCO_01700685v1 [Aquilegia coerulea]